MDTVINVTIYEPIKIEVDLGEVKTILGGGGGSAKIKPLEITSNGIYYSTPEADGYAPIRVEVPIPEGFLKPLGEKSIAENGKYDISTYASVDVNVPIPEGYINPSGTLDITSNGEHSVRQYDKVNVNVESDIPDDYIKPEGTLNITENGDHDVARYATAKVNVPIPDGYIIPSGTKEITENGEHDVKSFEKVNVSIPPYVPNIQPLSITENGTYTASGDIDGYSPIVVNIASSGGNSILPDGYQLVQYVQFDGSQIIDTGIICDQTTRIKVIYTRDASDLMYLYGVVNTGNTASVTAYLGSGNGSWRFGNKSVAKPIGTNPDLVQTAIVDKDGIDMANLNNTFTGVNDFETIGSLMIGSTRLATGEISTPQFVGKIIGFSIYKADELVLNFVPCKSKDGIYGLWDTVSNTFVRSITDNDLNGGHFLL